MTPTDSPAPGSAPPLGPAVRAWRDGDLETAARLCRERLDHNTLDADAWTLLARCALAWRRPKQALELCGRALVADPAHPEALVALGAVLGAMAAFAEAETACRRAVMVRPQAADGWRQWADVARLAGRHGRARHAARRVVMLHPEAPAAWIGLGTAQAAGGETLAAGRSLSRACRLAPDDADARARLRRLIELRRAEEARAAEAAAEQDGKGQVPKH